VPSISDFAAHWARFRGEHDAIVCGATRYTWRTFHERASRVAGALQSMGVRPGDRVGILLVSSAEWPVVFVATSMAGGVIVPLNPRFGKYELRGIEEDAECRVLVSTPLHAQDLADRFEIGTGDSDDIVLCPRRGQGGPVAYAHAVASETPHQPTHYDDDDLAAIFYTSGTTGVPKGTMHTHASIQSCIFGQTIGLGFVSSDKTLIMAPLAFTGACLSLLSPMLVVGGCAVIEPVYDPERMMQLIEAERITFITNVPAIWERLPLHPHFEKADFSSLRITLTGGAPVPVSLLKAFHPKSIVILQAYGATEGGGMLAYPTRTWALENPSSVGIPQVTVQLRVVDSSGADAPVGEIGEIWIKGPQVMKGYWRNPDATTAAFVEGWYKTGDLGAIDARGHITIVDRLKNMIISGGVNIYPAEVERAMATIEGVEEVGAFGQPDETWGERVVALIYSSRALDTKAVSVQARALLGAFKTPREIIVSPTPLPRTVTNKIAHKDLPTAYAALRQKI